MDEKELLHRLVALETAVSYNQPPPPGERPFAYTPGTTPVLLSAPHGAAHWRNGRYKNQDGYTTAFARLLGELTGAHVLYTTHRSDSDPNYDAASPYKRRLRRLTEQTDIQFVLDVHGMSMRYNFGIAVGTILGRSCPRQQPVLLETLQAHGFVPSTETAVRRFTRFRWDRFVLNYSRFTGGTHNRTVTRFVSQQLGIAAAQIELAPPLRVVRREKDADGRRRPAAQDASRIRRTLHTFAALVDRLSAG